MVDYYKVLGVSPSSSTNEIDGAFYKLKSKFSSDDTEDPYFKNFYRRILEAHNILSNKERRSKYDQHYKSLEIQIDHKKEVKEDTKEPVIEYFKSNKRELVEGGKMVLSWKTSRADEVILIPFGTVSAIGSKIIYYNDFEQEKIPFSLKVINTNSKKEISKDLFIGRAIEESKIIEKPKVVKVENKNHLDVQPDKLFEKHDVKIDNSSQSNIKKYGVPSGIGVLLIAIILFGLGQSGYWESSSQSLPEEGLPVINNEKPSSIIVLNWGNIYQEKELLIQNLKGSSKPDDQRILEFIDGIQNMLHEMNEDLYNDSNYDKLSSMLLSGSSSTDPDTAEFLETVNKNGFKINYSEGMPYLIGNTTFIRSVIETNIQNQLALQYLDLYIENIDRPCCEDAGLIISYNELIQRTYNWGEFLFDAQDSYLEDIAKKKFGSFLNLVFIGIDNTPAFDYENGLYNGELLEKLVQLTLENPFSLAAIEFKEYIKLLKEEKFERTNKIDDYVNSIGQANFDLSSDNFFVRFRDPDFNSISNEEKIRRLIAAENMKDFPNSGSYFANTIKTYYDYNNHTYIELNRFYNTLWADSEFYENKIHDIIKLDRWNFELITDFKYLDKEGDTLSQLRAAHYTFNEEGLIEEIYEIDSDYTYSVYRDSDFDYVSQEEKIHRLLKVENDRDFNKIASFFSSNMKRYWQTKNPTFNQIKNLYENAWKSSPYSRNNILHIEPLSMNTYDVNVSFTFHDNKADKLEVRNNFMRFVFNNNGLITEVYGVSKNSKMAEPENSYANGNLGSGIVESKNATDLDEKIIADVPFAIIENVPIYPGCESMKNNNQRKKCMSEKVQEFVQRKFNTDLGSQLGLTGINRVIVQFKIDKNGNITNVRSRAPHPRLEEEAARVINSLPKMQPGKHNGKKVGVMYSLPIVFQIQD